MIPLTEQYEFKYTNSDGKELTYKCSCDCQSWHDLIREFHYFLKGQGFIFDNDKIFVLKEGEYDW